MSTNPHFLEGVAHYKKEDFADAVLSFTKAIEKEENPNIYSERGIAYFHMKNLQKALEDLTYACDLEPENPYRYSSRAYIRDNMGDTKGAIEDYKKAIALDPDDAVAHNNLGLLEEKLGYMDSAKKHWKKADKLTENDPLPQNQTEETAAKQESKKPEEEIAPESTSFGQHFRVMISVFNSPQNRKEFWQFVRSGFKNKQ